MTNDNVGGQTQAPADGQPESGGKNRSVVVSKMAKIVFLSKSDESKSESVECVRDLFSVMDAIMGSVSGTESKEEMDDVLVTVLSVEDEDKSDPPAEGEKRWTGPYGVAGLEIDKMPVPEAMKALTSAVLMPDMCLKGVERLAEQFFLRSRLDVFIQICVFDCIPAVVPLVNSMREVKPESLAMLYQQMHIQAEVLRKWVGRQFPDMKVEWEKKFEFTRRPKDDEKASGLVLPNGQPVETRMKKD